MAVFTIVRTMAAVAGSAESAPTAGTAFVKLTDGTFATRVEWRVSGTAANTPTSGVVDLWRRIGDVVDLVDTQVITLATMARALPRIVTAEGGEFYATLGTVVGGSTPTFSFVVHVRPIAGS